MMEAANTSETSVNFYQAQQPRRQPSSASLLFYILQSNLQKLYNFSKIGYHTISGYYASSGASVAPTPEGHAVAM
jgi:hypothetical protein